MDKCKHGFDHACLICGFTHISGKKVWFDWAWQEQLKRIDELQARVDAALGLITSWQDQSYRDDAEQLICVDLEEALKGYEV